jgi:cytochrome c oxidase assembly factor CtaG
VISAAEWTELWTWRSPVWLIALGLLALYALACGRGAGRRGWCAVAAAGLLLVAFVSPLGALANGVMFSAHMLQHLLLLLVIPLLMLSALPAQTCERWFDRPRLDRIARVLAAPSLGWVLGVGAMWLWHEPALCSAATSDAVVGIIRNISFVLAGLAFWWPVAAPLPRYRVSPLLTVAYLVSACFACTLLGIYVTFSSAAICPVFAHPQAHLELVARLRDLGFTAAVDQQLGGLLMWVPPCLLYAGMSLHALSRWYGCNHDLVVVSHRADSPNLVTEMKS